MLKTGPRNGFTLVELLIVIVVIAILAAISIVAYNGIQNRSKDSRFKADAANVMKKAQVYQTLNGSYPYAANYTEFNFAGKEPDLGNLRAYYMFDNSGTSDLTYFNANGAAVDGFLGSGKPTYAVSTCKTGTVETGYKVFYPKSSDSSVQALITGTCT